MNLIIGLIKYLKGEFGIRNVKALAYYPKKDNPHFLQSRLGFDFFNMKDINWFCLPNTVTTRNFINENYDILLDVTDGEFIPQKFILHYSNSALKVGTFSKINKQTGMPVCLFKKSLRPCLLLLHPTRLLIFQRGWSGSQYEGYFGAKQGLN